VGLSDNTLKLWDWSTNTFLLNLNWLPQKMPNVAGSTWPGTNIKFLANGLVAAPYNSTTVNIWDVTTSGGGQVKFSLNHTVFGLEQLSNSNLASCGTDWFIKIWSTITGALLYQTKTADHHYALKQTNIPSYLASACSDENVYIWDINTLNKAYRLSGHSDQVYLLDLTPQGLLLSGSLDNTVKLWNVTRTIFLSSAYIGVSPTCMKVVSSNQLVVGFQFNYIKIINISSANVLTVASQVNLVTNSPVDSMRLTFENILLLGQEDGNFFFMNMNTTTFMQGLRPPYSSSVEPFDFDLIGIYDIRFTLLIIIH
jgi:WD40 repeat protein